MSKFDLGNPYVVRVSPLIVPQTVYDRWLKLIPTCSIMCKSPVAIDPRASGIMLYMSGLRNLKVPTEEDIIFIRDLESITGLTVGQIEIESGYPEAIIISVGEYVRE